MPKVPKSAEPTKPAKKKLIQPVAPTPPPPPALATSPAPSATPVNLKVIYDHLEITEYSTTSPKGPLTISDIVDLLDWETEPEYQKKRVEEEHAKGNKTAKPEHFTYGDVYHCRNVAGEKVRCYNNANNRPFDEDWCKSLKHNHLYGQWAGPFTIPGETVNGETIRVSRYGRIISGQHTLTSAKLANEQLCKDRKDGLDHPNDPKYPIWREHSEIFLETIIITGLSEDPRVLMTVDYVKPRSPSDVFYTSEVFKSAGPSERKELCRMLATAVDLLWTRTNAKGYRTHPELVAFLDRHKSLLKSVEHLFNENRSDPKGGRKISGLRLSAGNCAAIHYLMAASGTTGEDSDVYRNMDPAPSEKGIDFSLWDKADEFWTLLASSDDFEQVQTALMRLVDSSTESETNKGLGGLWREKLAILARAWERWKDHPDSAGPPFDDEDLANGGQLDLSYNDKDDNGKPLPNGQIKLLDIADFEGIDCPEVRTSRSVSTEPPDPPAPEQDEIWGTATKPGITEKLREEAEKRRAAKK